MAQVTRHYSTRAAMCAQECTPPLIRNEELGRALHYSHREPAGRAVCCTRNFHASDLYALLLTASEQIFATLAEHGRLPIPTLAHHSGIPSRRVRTGLANLLEAQLILHFAAEEDAPTFYSVNWRNAYNLARHTNIVELVNERFGERAGHLVGNILQLGHARVGDLAEAYELAPGSKRDSGVDGATHHATDPGMVNGAAKPSAANTSQMTSANEFHGTLRALLRSGILVKVGMRAFMPSSDLQEQIEEMVIVEQFPDRKVTGPKKQAEFKQAVHALKRKWRDDDTYSDLHDGGAKGAIKRPGEHFQPSNKRIKLNGAPNGLDAANGEQEVQKLSVLCCRPFSRSAAN